MILAAALCAMLTAQTSTSALELERYRLEREEQSCCNTLAAQGLTYRESDVTEHRCCKRLVEQYEKEGTAELGTDSTTVHDSADKLPTLGWQLVKTVFTLGFVVLLAYLLLGKLMPKLLRIEPPVAQRRIMQVIDRLTIDQRRSILVLRIGDQYFLVGASEGGIHLISKLDADEIVTTLATQDVEKPVLGKLAALLSRKRE